MPAWKGIVAKSFSPDEFHDYAQRLQWLSWRPSFVVLHNTGVPTLAQRPNGLSIEHIRGLEAFYRDEQKWSAGPHLFIDDKQIWVFTALTTQGVHSPSWNNIALGFEMLGDYSKEDFSTGRGLKVQNNAISALAIINSVLGIDPHTMKLHREDPLTTHACPGLAVRKLEIIQSVQDALILAHNGEHPIKPIA